MGYLDNTTVTVDAILTKRGRELLASGQGLNITQFALADDEVDYSLYDAGHPKGSSYYDASIKALPIIEASPDETQVMKYKLVTLPKTTTRIPTVSLGIPSITTVQKAGTTLISPTTSPSGNAKLGYTAVLSDKNAGDIVGEGLTGGVGSVPIYLGEDITATAAVAKGLTFRFIPNANLTSDVQTTLTIIGNETGGTATITVTVTYQADT